MVPYIVPDTGQPPVNPSYQYYGTGGLPYAGSKEMLTSDEFRQSAVMACHVGFGNFDTAKVDEQFCGRTLKEVLVKATTGEFRILMHREQWVQCPKFGVRVMQFIQWAEYIMRPRAEAFKNVNSAGSPQPTSDMFLIGRK